MKKNAANYRGTGCALVQGQDHLWSWDDHRDLGRRAEKKCVHGIEKLKNKRAVIPVPVVHWEIWDFEIFCVAPGTFFPKCCRFNGCDHSSQLSWKLWPFF